MLIVAWILFVVFGIITLSSLFTFFNRGLSTTHVIFWFLSVFITAFSAGAIWGGLLEYVK